MSIVVVTDSTAYLPDVAASHEVTVVPLHVVMGGVSGREGLEIGPSDVAHALSSRASVTTSQPTPGEFAAVYRSLFAAGAQGVVSIHLAAGLSGTIACAQAAAADASGPVEVIDSRSTGMGLGFPALAAAAATQGGDICAVRDAAVEAIVNTSTFFYVDTLEHLRKGGRITAVSALLGTALAVKPLLEIADGRILLRDKVRTAGRALDRLVSLVAEAAGDDGQIELAVHHLAARERAEYLADALRARMGDRLQALYTSEVGAVIAAHAGPGLAGVVVRRLHNRSTP